MRFQWTLGPLLLSLAACSGNPSKEAPIEQLGAKSQAATPVVAPKAAVASQPAPVTKLATESVAAQQPAAAGATTHPLGRDGIQEKSLPGTAKADSAAASAKPEAQAAAAPAPAPVQPPAAPAVVKPTASVIHFEYDSAALPATAQSLLEQHAAWLRLHQGDKVIIQGHADDRGSREYNLALGQKRAESVKQALGLVGVPEAQMEAVSLGEEKPLVEGEKEEVWRQNRRAEIHYQGQ